MSRARFRRSNRGLVRAYGFWEPELGEQRGIEEAAHMGNAPVGQRQHLKLERTMCPIRMFHVEGQCGLSVGGGRHHDLVARPISRTMRLDEMPDCDRSFVPTKVWRHLPDRILCKKLDNPLDVIVLECGHVIGEQPLPVLVVEWLLSGGRGAVCN